MLSSRDRFGGKGVVCCSLVGLRLTVDGGDGGLDLKQSLISHFTPDLPLVCETYQDTPSPNPFWRKDDRFICTWGGTPLLAR